MCIEEFLIEGPCVCANFETAALKSEFALIDPVSKQGTCEGKPFLSCFEVFTEGILV